MRVQLLALALCLALALPGMVVGSKMFADILHDVKAGVGSRASVSNDRYRADVKHLRLQEAKHYNCRQVGCVDVEECNGGDSTDDDGRRGGNNRTSTRQAGTDCPDCTTHLIFQSDLTCCDENKHKGGDSDYSYLPPLYDSPFLRIGTCDWDIVLDEVATCWLNPENAGCGTVRRESQKKQSGINLDLAVRVGTAWSTCYLASGADECDDILCDKMVLRFQGALYFTPAQSDKIAGVGSYILNELVNGGSGPDYDGQWCGPPLGNFPNATKKIQTRSEPTNELTPGLALVATGTVSLTSMERKVDYSYGTMDYVYDFASDELAIDRLMDHYWPDGAPSGELPVVTPNTYKLKLVNDKQSSF